MRILLLAWKDMAHPAAGGAEVYCHEVFRRAAAAGHHVTLFTGRPEGAAPEATLDGIRTVRQGGRLSVYPRARRYALHHAGHFDVIVDEINTRPFLSPRWSPLPVVALAHQVAREVWDHEVPFPLSVIGRRWLEVRWLRSYRSVPVLTVSESSRASLAEYGLSDIRIVPEGSDLPDLPEGVGKEEQPTVLFVGRLVANKRPQDALEAFRLVRARVPEAQMWVVGTGPQERGLRARFGADGVVFHGRVPEARKVELMARAHVLAVTSVREGWGLVVSEAAAAGTKSVAYDVPGLRDSVPPASGVLVAPTPRDLAEGLVAALARPDDQPRAGARHGVSDWDEVAEQVLGHLTRAAAGPPPPRRRRPWPLVATAALAGAGMAANLSAGTVAPLGLVAAVAWTAAFRLAGIGRGLIGLVAVASLVMTLTLRSSGSLRGLLLIVGLNAAALASPWGAPVVARWRRSQAAWEQVLALALVALAEAGLATAASRRALAERLSVTAFVLLGLSTALAGARAAWPALRAVSRVNNDRNPVVIYSGARAGRGGAGPGGGRGPSPGETRPPGPPRDGG